MLTNYINTSRVIKRMNVNYFHYIFEDYVLHLHLHGYQPNTIRCYCQALEHFGCWIKNRKISKHSIDQTQLHDFIKHLTSCQCRFPRTKNIKIIQAAINQLLKILPSTSQEISFIPAENDIIKDFADYLINVCGTAKNTIIYRKRYAFAFLQYARLKELSQIEDIFPKQIISFIKQFSSNYTSGSMGVVSTSLRSFLKYVVFLGYKVKNLLDAVPHIPNWRLSQVPEFLTQLDVKCQLTLRVTTTNIADFSQLTFFMFVFGTITLSGNMNDRGVMYQPIDRGNCHHIIRKNSIPLTKRLISRDDQTACFITMTN
jgi:site-specific recombinase XerD